MFRTPVSSSNLRSVGYDAQSSLLEIEFQDAQGWSVLFKVVKTRDAPAFEPLTVTLCTIASGLLPPAGSEITLQILSE